MFNLQGSEIIIILLLALVVLGPEKLPEAMRKAGKFYADIRKMSSGFQDEFRAAMDEPIKEVRETANMLRDSADFTALADGERDEKPQSAGGPGVTAEEAMPTSVEIDDDEDEDDERSIDPSVGAGEGLAPPAGSSPVDISKPKAHQPPPPPPPPPFTGSTTLGPSVVDETNADGAPPVGVDPAKPAVFPGSDTISKGVPPAEPVQAAPAPSDPFSGSTTLGLGVADGANAATAPTPPSPPSEPPDVDVQPQPGAEDAPA